MRLRQLVTARRSRQLVFWVLLFAVISGSIAGYAQLFKVYRSSFSNIRVVDVQPNVRVVDVQPTVSEQLRANTVILTDGFGHGSGLLFTRGDVTFIWTAGHVANVFKQVDGSYAEFTVIQGSKRGKAKVLRVGKFKPTIDCALLEVTEGDFHGDATFAYVAPKLGQEVIHCGTPGNQQSNERLISYGRVSGLNRVIESETLHCCDIAASPGCSGGPVVDAESGRVIGFVVRAVAPGIAAMVSAEQIRQWARDCSCLWAFDRFVPMPDERHVLNVEQLADAI